MNETWNETAGLADVEVSGGNGDPNDDVILNTKTHNSKSITDSQFEQIAARLGLNVRRKEN